VSARSAELAQRQTFAKQSPLQHCPSAVQAPFCGTQVVLAQRPAVQASPLQHVEVPVPEHVAPTAPHVPALHMPPLQRRPLQQSALVAQMLPFVWHRQRRLAASHSM